ncbi:MAG: septum formation initiator family protein [Proteobacteria bacterium]|nr:septum formation initiator family protein [Pseudomonadota bacterium]
MKVKYALIIVSIFLAHSIISSSGVRYIFKINNEIRKVKKEITALKEENKEQEAKLKEVHNNPRLLEIYARTKLGMVRPDEVIYELK